LIVRPFWGRGYATEAARAMIAYAFETMKLPRVLADTSADNERSQNVMKRLGMRLVSAPRPGWRDRVVGLLENKVLLPGNTHGPLLNA
jgi:RimJ/RimL family protein N-acetyltransferase